MPSVRTKGYFLSVRRCSCGTSRSLSMMPGIATVPWDGRIPVEKDARQTNMKKMSAYFPPVEERRSTDVPYLKRSVILMKTILPIWRIWISVTAPGSMVMRTGMSLRQLYCTMAVHPPGPGIICGRQNCPPPIMSVSSGKTCRFFSGS